MALKIETKYIDYKHNPWGYQETNDYDDICTHNTGNSASADEEWAYMNRMQTQGHPTVHYFVDETKAIKCMPYKVDAWAVSDGAGKGGNTTDIHIEICRSKSDNATYQKAFDNAMELIAIICKELGWKPKGRIKFHYDYKTKYCPHKSLDDFEGNLEKLRSHVISEVNKILNAEEKMEFSRPKLADWSQSSKNGGTVNIKATWKANKKANKAKLYFRKKGTKDYYTSSNKNFVTSEKWTQNSVNIFYQIGKLKAGTYTIGIELDGIKQDIETGFDTKNDRYILDNGAKHLMYIENNRVYIKVKK